MNGPRCDNGACGRLKTRQYMETEVLFTVEEAAEGGLLARAHAHGIFVQAESELELAALVRDAVDCHFDGTEKPKLIRLHFVRDQVLVV